MRQIYSQMLLPFFTLFTSAGTLVCCALPALFVTLGMGAALAGFISVNPWITAVSDYKPEIFFVSGLLIAFAAIMQYRARNLPCPADPKAARVCGLMRKASLYILGFSALTWATGFFFAFIAVYIFF